MSSIMADLENAHKRLREYHGSISEVARVLGISYERVRQILNGKFKKSGTAKRVVNAANLVLDKLENPKHYDEFVDSVAEKIIKKLENSI